MERHRNVDPSAGPGRPGDYLACCLFCGEPLVYEEPEDEHEDDGPLADAANALHRECRIRMQVGSVGHQNRRCSCFGGADEDPPDMTLRQAAQAAADLWQERRKSSQFGP